MGIQLNQPALLVLLSVLVGLGSFLSPAVADERCTMALETEGSSASIPPGMIAAEIPDQSIIEIARKQVDQVEVQKSPKNDGTPNWLRTGKISASQLMNAAYATSLFFT